MSGEQIARAADGVAVPYDVEGVGPTLVLVHGLGDDRSVWSPLRRALGEGVRSVALDLRGHGRSLNAADFDAFGLDRDVHAVLDALDVHDVLLVGHSLGGFVVTLAGASPRVRALINVDQPLDFAGLGERVRALENALAHEQPSTVVWRVLEQLGLGDLSDQQVAALRATRGRLTRRVVLGAWAPFLANDEATLAARMDAQLAQLHKPYVSLHGCAMPEGYPAWLATRLQHAEIEDWQGIGHFPHLSAVDRLAALVRKTLQHV